MDHGIHDKQLPTLTCCRRTALAIGGLAFASSAGAISPPSLIRKISHETLWSNLDGSGTSWFHPRACMVPHADGQLRPLMTLQAINGSDFFGPVHWTSAATDGRHWSAPQPIAAFDQRPVPGHAGLRAGVCDVVPEYHPPTNTALAVGHVVFYRGERFSRGDQLARYPLYAVRKAALKVADEVNAGASLTLVIFIVKFWLVELVPSLAVTTIEYEVLDS